MLFVLTAYLSTSCEKEQIAPRNQEVAFVKYYGHVGAQTATDIIQTSDGGYILLGSTNSYSAREEMDILVVKTDSLGNELWSSAFGRASGTVDSKFGYLRFSEEGIRIVELPDQSAYVVAANRTYYESDNENSSRIDLGQTKIVLYQLDPATGAPSSTNGMELRTNTNHRFTEVVSDMKIDTIGGLRYILTGYTTDIKPNKPNDNDNGLFDKTDVFTVLLNSDFTIAWQTTSLVYGFPGSDYGTSVQVIGTQGYLICGLSDINYNNGGSTNYNPGLLVVLMEKGGGTPLNEKEYGEEGYYFEAGHSTLNTSDNVVTVAVNIDKTSGSNGDKGKIGLMQFKVLDDDNFLPVTPNGLPPSYCQFYDIQGRKGGGGAEHLAASIVLLPSNDGFVLSSTQRISDFESDICITKFDKDLNVKEGWPYYFGYSDQSSLVLTNDQAGTIIPVISGGLTSNQSTVTGYVFTGKFGLGTNEMMGMVKLNLNGTLTP